MWRQFLITTNCVRFLESGDILFLVFSFFEELLFCFCRSYPCFKGMACLSQDLGCFFNPVNYFSFLTLIIHSYELMLLSIILCQKDLSRRIPVTPYQYFYTNIVFKIEFCDFSRSHNNDSLVLPQSPNYSSQLCQGCRTTFRPNCCAWRGFKYRIWQVVTNDP